MKYFNKYRQNLKYDDNFVYSYDTKVALIDKNLGNLVKVSWNVGGKTSSPTTSKHVNYAAKELKLHLVEFNFNKK